MYFVVTDVEAEVDSGNMEAWKVRKREHTGSIFHRTLQFFSHPPKHTCRIIKHTMTRIAILTMCIGADYIRAMEPGLASKRAYAEKHGYDLHIGGADVWDRSRPIQWSKFNYIRKYLDSYDYIFWSDADVIILDQDKSLETQVLPLLPADKDILWTYDACNHYNNGHLLIRGRSAWVRDYFNRCYEQTQFLHHIWWDNAAMIHLYESNAADKAKIETCREHWRFNSYVFGPNDSAMDPSARLYQPGDFLVHFAGVYEPLNIYRMMKYVAAQHARGAPVDPALLDNWRRNPPVNKSAADASLPITFS